MLRLGRGVYTKQCRQSVQWRQVPWVGYRKHGLSTSNTSSTSTTNVEKIILDSIRTTGPISLTTYMQLCLSHPTEGYYMNPANAVFGARGDFTTSPEISQVFGELAGIWLLSQWMKTGQNSSFRLIELGPGRGTLMADVLRTVSQFPVAQSALRQVHLVETSANMRTLQKQKLLPLSQRNGWELLWHDSVDDVPRDAGLFTMLLAHEFFDALPIHLLERTHQGWQEVLIASNLQDFEISNLVPPSPQPSANPSKPRLRLVLTPSPTPTSTLLGLSSPRFQKLPIGARLEVSPAAFKIARSVAEVISGGSSGIESSGGAALIVDYGGEKAYGNSFRAFKDHKIVDVFHQPGECDLTANVDFAYLKEAMAGLATTHGILAQADFLERMGFKPRVDALTSAAPNEERKEAIVDAAQRLVDRTGMGTAYQVLGVTTVNANGSAGACNSGGTWPFVTDGGIGGGTH